MCQENQVTNFSKFHSSHVLLSRLSDGNPAGPNPQKLMAACFFRKLFRKCDNQPEKIQPEPSPEWKEKFERFDNLFDASVFRFLAFRESAYGHKSLLFDSKHTQRFAYQDETSFDFVNENFGYKVTKGCDTERKLLAECMFGTIPISRQSETVKLHFLPDLSNESEAVLWSLTYPLVIEKEYSSSTPSSFALSPSTEFDSGFFSQKPSMIIEPTSVPRSIGGSDNYLLKSRNISTCSSIDTSMVCFFSIFSSFLFLLAHLKLAPNFTKHQ